MGMTVKEICENNLVSLGEAMMQLLNGQKLSTEQITLIKESSDKQKNLAIMMKAATTLKGQEYTNYCHNVRRLNKK